MHYNSEILKSIISFYIANPVIIEIKYYFSVREKIVYSFTHNYISNVKSYHEFLDFSNLALYDRPLLKLYKIRNTLIKCLYLVEYIFDIVPGYIPGLP